MSLLAIFFSALFFILLGVIYVKGYDFVKGNSPEKLPQFYIVLAAIRMLLVVTIVAIYVIMSPSRQQSVHFSAMFLGMYAVMMIITLILKH